MKKPASNNEVLRGLPSAVLQKAAGADSLFGITGQVKHLHPRVPPRQVFGQVALDMIRIPLGLTYSS